MERAQYAVTVWMTVKKKQSTFYGKTVFKNRFLNKNPAKAKVLNRTGLPSVGGFAPEPAMFTATNYSRKDFYRHKKNGFPGGKFFPKKTVFCLIYAFFRLPLLAGGIQRSSLNPVQFLPGNILFPLCQKRQLWGLPGFPVLWLFQALLWCPHR